jgi:hypothetical protein
MSKQLHGICDKCSNSNVQPLHRYGSRELCDLCLEEEKDGRVAKRQRDMRFTDELHSIQRSSRQ